MPSTIDHKVEMFHVAQSRRAAGLPVWERRLNFADVVHNEALSFEQRRDAIVDRLRHSAWFAGRDEFDELVEAVDNLARADDADEFDGWWDEIYDVADYDRVWIVTR